MQREERQGRRRNAIESLAIREITVSAAVFRVAASEYFREKSDRVDHVADVGGREMARFLEIEQVVRALEGRVDGTRVLGEGIARVAMRADDERRRVDAGDAVG